MFCVFLFPLLPPTNLRLQRYKQQIALMSSDVIESPEEKFRMLGDLNDLCRCKVGGARTDHVSLLRVSLFPPHAASFRAALTPQEQGVAHTVRRLAIVSTTSVYKDIIPGYYIRALTEMEKGEAEMRWGRAG